MIDIQYATKEADTVLIRGDAIQSLKEMEDNSVDSIVTDPPYGLSFMGKKWDYDVPQVELWKEVFRVLKHGGHLLSFAGTRTYHRMAVNIEDAGFEIRDMISWLYGSGFPKSLNIGKQVDKIQGNERETVGENKNGAKKLMEERPWNQKEDYNKTLKLTKGNSKWEGWGTALKPACEPIVVARKPLSEKNIALNVLKQGTGGINIDGCRVGDEKIISRGGRKEVVTGDTRTGKALGMNAPHEPLNTEHQGRFPANIILDEEAGKILDKQTIGKVGNGHWSKTTTKGFGEFGGGSSTYEGVGKKDKEKGGASRFFYCAKASKSERNFGLDDFEEKGIEIQQPHNSKDLEERYSMKSKNFHPTVKPIKLMQYLVRLVTPKGAICLDPFMGSGTTGIACVKEEIKFVGIEREEEYLKIATARIDASRKKTERRGDDD